MIVRNSTGNLDFASVTPEIIAELDEPSQKALLALMQAVDVKNSAVNRRAAANRRFNSAVDDEDRKRVLHEDASSPIPFSVAALEQSLGRALNQSEMAAAREQHAIRVRGLLERRAREAAIEAYNKSH